MSIRTISKTKLDLTNRVDVENTGKIPEKDVNVTIEHLGEKKNTSTEKLLFDLCEISLLTHMEKLLEGGEI